MATLAKTQLQVMRCPSQKGSTRIEAFCSIVAASQFGESLHPTIGLCYLPTSTVKTIDVGNYIPNTSKQVPYICLVQENYINHIT